MIELALNWIPLLNPNVPRHIFTQEGQIEVTNEILANEIELATSIRPTRSSGPN